MSIMLKISLPGLAGEATLQLTAADLAAAAGGSRSLHQFVIGNTLPLQDVRVSTLSDAAHYIYVAFTDADGLPAAHSEILAGSQPHAMQLVRDRVGNHEVDIVSGAAKGEGWLFLDGVQIGVTWHPQTGKWSEPHMFMAYDTLRDLATALIQSDPDIIKGKYQR